MTSLLQTDKNLFQFHIIFIGMNPLKDRAANRAKDNIREIRHVCLDLDENAKLALASVRDSLDVPPPNFALDTSSSKYQVFWKVDGVDLEQAESLLHSLATHFGGSLAYTYPHVCTYAYARRPL